MKNLKFAFLAVAIGIAPALTAKGADAAAEAILGPLNLMDEIKTSQETLKNIDYLLQFSAKLMVVNQVKWENNEKADAKADYLAALSDYQNLLAWRERISGRIAYDQTILGGVGISAVGRDAAKDGAWEAAKAAASDVRGSVRSTIDGMKNCPDGH
jgi:hypothetical protein